VYQSNVNVHFPFCLF